MWRFLIPIEKALIGLVRLLAHLFDLQDVFFFGGLLVAGFGGWTLSPSWTLVAIGAVLALKGHGPLIIIRRSAS